MNHEVLQGHAFIHKEARKIFSAYKKARSAVVLGHFENLAHTAALGFVQKFASSGFYGFFKFVKTARRRVWR